VDASVGRAWYRVTLVTAIVLALDQATKALVRSSIDPGTRHKFLPAIDLVNVRNRGIAFGLFTENATLLTVLTLIALAFLLVYFARHTDRALAWLPTGLLLGGALGNMFDRLHRGAVTDFIDVPLWPSFNVADMAITFGVLSLLYVIEQGPPAESPPAQTPSAHPPRHAEP
jgi:signal peptidase II